MASKTKNLEITITDDKGAFSSFFNRVSGEKHDFDFKGLASLRSLLSNEKARIIHIIKTKNPKSIYEVSKLVQRDFKSVFSDISALEQFGIIDLVKEKSGSRERLKPILIIDTIKIELKI
jgi:predicted transcriptional regulator